jgi:hypothetical protein
MGGQMKRRIRQNQFGNWYGYEGTRKVIAFSETPCNSQEEQAQAWLRGETLPELEVPRTVSGAIDLRGPENKPLQRADTAQ